MSFCLVFCAIWLVRIIDACQQSERERQKYREDTSDFLVLWAFKAVNLLDSAGQLVMNEEKLNTPRVNSTCSRPFKFASTKMGYSHLMKFKIQKWIYTTYFREVFARENEF